MNKLQLYALDQVLYEYPEDMTYEEILDQLSQGDDEDMYVIEAFETDPPQVLGNRIEQFRSDAEDWFGENPDKITIEWSVYDVKAQAEREGMYVSTRDAQEILRMLKQSHNAEVGINWNVISDTIGVFKDIERIASYES